jgi:chromosome partitioning protein
MSSTARVATYLDKGGTGKTTCTAHLGVALQEHGDSVLLVDLAGKQGDLAKVFGVWDEVKDEIRNEDDFPNIATTMRDRWGDIANMLSAEEVVRRLVKSTDEGVDLIPAHPDLDGLDDSLGNVDDIEERYTRLRRFLDEYIDSMDYDVVLLDLPGSSDHITYNGLWAAGSVMAPVQMGPFELEQARGLREDIKKTQNNYGESIELTMLIPNLYDRRTNLDEEVLEQFTEEFGDILAPSTVVDSQQIRSATDTGNTIFALQENELSKTARDAKDAFKTNAIELRDRLSEKQ